MRPISIIPELSKIVSKLLAKRLLDILTLNPTLLHKSQRGFLRTGNIGQCIDALIDILEDNKQYKRGVHIASYDQRKAYDSVQHYTIRMSLERLNMPDSFVSYVMSSITDSEAVDVCVHQGVMPEHLDTVEYTRFIEVLTPEYRTRAPKRIVALAARLRSLYQHLTST